MPINQYGFDFVAWEQAKAEARDVIVQRARQRARIPYSELVSHIGAITIAYNDPRLSYFLDEISSEEDEQGRGLLTVIVVHKQGDMQPGPGFFEMAQRRGRNTSDELRCWVEEFNRVHDYWANRHP